MGSCCRALVLSRFLYADQVPTLPAILHDQMLQMSCVLMSLGKGPAALVCVTGSALGQLGEIKPTR